MEYYAGIDVSLEYSSVCVVDGTGKIFREAKVASDPGCVDQLAQVAGLRTEPGRAGSGAVVAVALCGDTGSGAGG